jgi:hypothetical protein
MTRPVIAVVNNAVLTTSGNSAGVLVLPVGNVGGPVYCHVAVTAVSGSTPTLVVSLQWSWNSSTWITANTDETFTTFTSVGAALLVVPSRGLYVRSAWTVAGTTPSFTAAIALWS